jgi:hypothetical protein
MIPGFAIFKRVGSDWLVSRMAFFLFAASTVLIAVVTLVLLGIPKISGTTASGNIIGGVLGVAGALSVFFLWAGMWHYWLRVDTSRPATKRLWFIVLLAGFWYGAIMYFLLKYLWIDKMGRKAFSSKGHA